MTPVKASRVRSRAGIQTPTGASPCSSATSIETRNRLLDIPVGPNNRIDPGGPDMGQPTHFLLKRQWGVFTITVPKDFADKKLTWTLVVNGETSSVPLSLHPKWAVQPFKDPSVGNTPPVVRLEANGTPLQGPPHGISASFTTTRSNPHVDAVGHRRSDSRSSQSPEAGRATNHRFLEPGTRTRQRDF